MAKHAQHASKSSSLVPLLILLVVLCIAGAIGYVIYSIAQDVAAKTSQKMEKKNISLSREGVKVGVKEVSTEDVADSTQNVLVKMWSNASFKGRFDSWSTPTSSATGSPSATPGVGAEKRKPFSRSASSQQKVSRS